MLANIIRCAVDCAIEPEPRKRFISAQVAKEPFIEDEVTKTLQMLIEAGCCSIIVLFVVLS